MNDNIQSSLIEAMKILVDNAINNTHFTTSQVGLVKQVSGFDCTVELLGSDTECKILEHLQTKIRQGDIVIVQDLYNDNTTKYVQSKIGEAIP